LSLLEKLFQSIHLGVGFFFLFSAYSTTQDLLSSLFKDYGLYALIIIYGGFVFSSFFSGFILSKTGTRFSYVPLLMRKMLRALPVILNI